MAFRHQRQHAASEPRINPAGFILIKFGLNADCNFGKFLQQIKKKTAEDI